MEGNAVYLLWALAGVLVLIGFAGTILPALPGVPLVFSGLFLAAYLGNFEKIGVVTLTILGLLAALALVADFAATLLGAKRAGASKLALLGAGIARRLGILVRRRCLLRSKTMAKWWYGM